MIGPRVRSVLLVGLVLATIGCDRVTKHVALVTLANRPSVSLLNDTIRLQYVENPGGFLSLGADWPVMARTAVFAGATGLIQIGLMVVAIQRRWVGVSLLGALLCVAGGSSNWIDRVLHGRVVDFLNLGLGPVRTGIFNVADVAVVVGGLLLLIGLSRRPAPAISEPPPISPA